RAFHRHPAGLQPSFIELVLGAALLAANVHGPSSGLYHGGPPLSHFSPGARRLWRGRCARYHQLHKPRRMREFPHHRSAGRANVVAFVLVRGDDGAEVVFRTRDLSIAGLFLYTRVARAYPFRIGSALALEFFDDVATFRCKVVVARVVEP